MTINRPALPQQCNVAIIGSGPSGLALAITLAKLGVGDVHILEREAVAGGVPRHCGHYPFGVFEFNRPLKGPDYARRLVDQALASGCSIHLNTSVTQLGVGGLLSIATPDCTAQLQAKRVALCTGIRESSRAQRMLGGDRPLGVVSTGALQSMVYEQSLRPFQRPVILGTELVSFSSILTCRHAGIKPVAMLEENHRITARRIAGALPRIIGLSTKFSVSNINIRGGYRVETIDFEDASGKAQSIAADGLIVSGQFRPESTLPRMSHLIVDHASGGPQIDQYGRCSDPAYFSAGNVLRPVETSAWCWREGADLAAAIAGELSSPDTAAAPSVPVVCLHPALRYCVPQRLVRQTDSSTGALQLRVTRPVKGKLIVTSNGQRLWTGRVRSRPERRILIPLKSILPTVAELPIEVSIEEDQ